MTSSLGRRRARVKAVACVLAPFILMVAACDGGIDTRNVASSTSTASGIRQTDAAGQSLPFENQFEKRWNSSNDGTAYEPCTAVDQAVADRVGLDQSSTADAAAVSGQTLRGCKWHYAGEGMEGWYADQIVADSESLAAYKKLNRSFTWREDIVVSDRNVGVGAVNQTSCFTYVQAEGSGVVTGAAYHSLPAPTLDEVCRRAIDLTRATIDKVPNG
ncbi:DUF3558 family protein [Gordonia tangerina]|uniref:DUF3558 domain-containing protein n=1 Tax=Gordonia tangerina TaxID=2911060 RepID=A0ABS9DCX4_9ACTN|nr:DUF3558 family protein [Gordonia tangerina]MCF3936947.1 DUF3558 domain-containing protein [Gordonia tangerina]